MSNVNSVQRFRRILFRSILAPAAGMLLLAAGLLWQTQILLDATAWVDHSDAVLIQAESAQKLMIDLETGVRGYLLTGDRVFLDPYRQARPQIDPTLATLAQLVQDNPAQAQRIAHVQADYAEWLSSAETLLRLHDSGGAYQTADVLLPSKQQMDDLRTQLSAFMNAEEQLRAERNQALRQTTQLVIGVGLLALLVVGGALAFTIRRQLFSVIGTYDRALTDVQQQSAALQASEERYRVTLESIGDAVITTDTAGRVTFLNNVAEALTGWPSAEALGQDITRVFPIFTEHTLQAVENPVLRTLRDGRVVGLANHTILVDRGGEMRPIDDSGAPIFNPSGVILGAVLVFRDISARRRAEQEREDLFTRTERARAEAEAAVKLRDGFFSVAAHELKTPLTSLFGNLQLLDRRATREGFLSQRDRRTLDVVVAQTRRLQRMIEALLDVTRMEAGQLRLDLTRLDLGELVQQVIAEVQPTLTQHTIAWKAPPDPLMIEGDALRLEQVIQNLLQNAVKYSPEGGPVEVELTRCGDQACLAVTDHGIGIPQDELPMLFSRFYRAANVSAQHISGMGIGLYVVKEIVALHGGSAEVASEENRGSTFRICLPLAQQ